MTAALSASLECNSKELATAIASLGIMNSKIVKSFFPRSSAYSDWQRTGALRALFETIDLSVPSHPVFIPMPIPFPPFSSHPIRPISDPAIRPSRNQLFDVACTRLYAIRSQSAGSRERLVHPDSQRHRRGSRAQML